jgi:hypothetical protein
VTDDAPVGLKLQRDLEWWRFRLAPDFDGGFLPARFFWLALFLSAAVVWVLYQAGPTLWGVLFVVLGGLLAEGLRARKQGVNVVITERSVRFFRPFLAGPCLAVNLHDIARVSVVERGSGRSLMIHEVDGSIRQIQTDSSADELDWVARFLESQRGE